MIKKIKTKISFFIIFLLILFIFSNKIHYDFYKIINNSYKNLIDEAYGNCNYYGLKFIKKSLDKLDSSAKIAIYNNNDLAGIKWKFQNFNKLKYIKRLDKNVNYFDYIILISLPNDNKLEFNDDKVKIENVTFKIKNKFKNCYFISKK